MIILLICESPKKILHPTYLESECKQILIWTNAYLTTLPTFSISLDILKSNKIFLNKQAKKYALSIILGQKYKSYKFSLRELNLGTLFTRRVKLCQKFANKAQKHPKFSKWVKSNNKKSVTRSKTPNFCDVYFRTERFKRSPISYLTRILNSQ